MSANLYPFTAAALATLVGAFTVSLAGCDREKPDAVETVLEPASTRAICDQCLGDDGKFHCCDDQGGPGGEDDTSFCSEFEVQGEFWRALGKCEPGRPDVRCNDQCITNLCQAHDSSTNDTWATTCPKTEYLSSAWKNGIEFNGDQEYFNHTYFCLTGNWSDCYTIVGWGFNSTKSGGEKVPETTYQKSSYQVCLAQFRASNNVLNACGLFSEAYGINGVCHQHTNRGQLSMHGTWMNPDYIEGGALSFALYGPYGLAIPWAACYGASKLACHNQ